MLRLKKYPSRSPYWYVIGTVAKIRIFRTTRTTDKIQAETYRIKVERETWERGALGKERPATWGEAMTAYRDSGGSDRFLLPLLDHFGGGKLLTEIGQAEIERAAKAICPNAKPAIRVRCIYGPVIAILRHAARKAKLPGAVTPDISTPKIDPVPPKWAGEGHLEKLLPHCGPTLAAFVLVSTFRAAGLRDAAPGSRRLSPAPGLGGGEPHQERRPSFRAAQ